MEHRIDTGGCAGDVLAAADLIFSGVAGCENRIADFAVLAKIFALDAGDRGDDLCRGIGAPADWHDRFPGKLDLAAETGNGPCPLRDELATCAYDATEEPTFSASILCHLRGQVTKTHELRKRHRRRACQCLERQSQPV